MGRGVVGGGLRPSALSRDSGDFDFEFGPIVKAIKYTFGLIDYAACPLIFNCEFIQTYVATTVFADKTCRCK